MFPLLLSVYTDGGKGLFFINMRLIESKVEYLPQENGIEGIYKMIEIAGRTAYQSLDKITDDSAKVFVDRMINSKHFAALEHGTVYLFYSVSCYNREGQKWVNKYEGNPYSKVICIGVDDNEPGEDGNYYDIIGNEACGNEQYVIITNYRVLVENNWLDDLRYLCEPTEFHEKRYTFRFITDIGVCRELLRHRVFSFLNESTRYCNYSKGKFDEELTSIRPDRSAWEKTDTSNGDAYWAMLRLTDEIESVYMQAIKEGVKPEIARQVLPLATKTELIMTGFSSDWRYLLDLRLYGKTGKPHPDMLNLMEKLRYEALEAGIWYDIMKYPSKFK